MQCITYFNFRNNPIHYTVDSIEDFKKLAKIAEPYTEAKEFYKKLKTNQKSNFYYCKNSSRAFLL